MNINQVASQIGVTSSRAGTISRQLFGEVPVEFDQGQLDQMSAVAEYMKSTGERSVKRAIAVMTSGDTATPEQQTAPSMNGEGGLNQVFAGVVDSASDQYADMVTAGIIQQTMAKVGRTDGTYTSQAIENFTQGILPQAEDLSNAGMMLPGCNPQSTLLLAGSSVE